MGLYQLAFAAGIVCFFAVAVIQVSLRNQVHRAYYGTQEIRPFDVRFANDLVTIWKMHKREFETSILRTSLIVGSVGAVLFLGIAALDYALSR
jgi:hypothetical protein